MNLLRSLRIGTRLASAFGLLLIMMVVLAITGLVATFRISERVTLVYQDRAVPLQRLSEMNQLLQRNRALLMDMLIDPGRANVERHSQEFTNNDRRIASLWSDYAVRPVDGDERAAQDRFTQTRDVYLHQGLKAAVQAMVDGRYDDAQELYLLKVKPLEADVQAALSHLLALKLGQANQEYESSLQFRRVVVGTLLAITLLALLVGIGLSWAITRSISLPLSQAVDASQRVAQGDLANNGVPVGRDEMAGMLHALADMRRRLTAVIGEVRQVCDGVVTGTGEIAAGSADLSQRTEAQVSHLHATAAAMTQLRAAVDRNAQIARSAAELATQARSAADAGGQLMQSVVTTMGEISGSSHRIADITGVIDAIAFQTNILALNAAVEAARAGDAGRGFAVVAGEVRSLAQRSAAAAREIKTLIAASVDRVEAGSALVERAGHSVQAMVDQIGHITDMIDAMAQASAEQASRLSEMHDAVGHLEAMTQRNAALVEETTAAAESLRRQAAHLAETVRFFRLAPETRRDTGTAAHRLPSPLSVA